VELCDAPCECRPRGCSRWGLMYVVGREGRGRWVVGQESENTRTCFKCVTFLMLTPFLHGT
jgi:hypothetical protein